MLVSSTDIWPWPLTLGGILGNLEFCCLKLTKACRIYSPLGHTIQFSFNGITFFGLFVMVFYCAACNATHDIAVAILSVRLSVRCVYCDKTKWCTADILIPHETASTQFFRHQHWLVGDVPFPVKYSPKVTRPSSKKCRLRPISTYNVPIVKDSKIHSIMMNMKSTTGFPTSYRQSVYVTLNPERVARKAIFRFFWNKSQL